MVKLPTREDLGGLPNPRGQAPIARIDTSAEQRGVQRLARGIEAFGEGIDQLRVQVEAKRRKRDEFELEQKLQEFDWSERLRLEEETQNIGSDQADGYALRHNEGFMERANEFFDSEVPDELRPMAEKRLFQTERSLYSDALGFQRKGEKQFALNAIEQTSRMWHAKAFRGDADVSSIQAEMSRVVRASGLSALDQEEQILSLKDSIASSFLDGVINRDPDDAVIMLESALNGDLTEGPVADMSVDAQMSALRRAENESARREASEETDNKEYRDSITKDLYNSLHDGDLTDDAIEAYRDELSVTNYKALKRAVHTDEGRKTDPETFIALSELVDTDPDVALEQLDTLFSEDNLAKSDYLKLRGRAERRQPTSRYDSLYREGIRQSLRPEQENIGTINRQRDAIMAWDDWLEDNKDADRDKMLAAQQGIIKDFRKIHYDSETGSLPPSRFLTVPIEEATLLDIDKAVAKLRITYELAEMPERQLARDAALLRRWRDVLRFRLDRIE